MTITRVFQTAIETMETTSKSVLVKKTVLMGVPVRIIVVKGRLPLLPR